MKSPSPSLDKVERPSLPTDKPAIDEPDYKIWCSWKIGVDEFCALPEDISWNVSVCIVVLGMMVAAIMEYDVDGTSWLDIGYNVGYGVHVAAVIAATARRLPNENVSMSVKELICCANVRFELPCNLFPEMFNLAVFKQRFLVIFLGSFLLDLVSYLHYAVSVNNQNLLKLICYYIRLHRPFRYIWEVDNNHMQGSLVVKTLMYIYICLVVRVTCAYVWLHVDSFEAQFITDSGQRVMLSALRQTNETEGRHISPALRFFVALYVINKMFIPIGPTMHPDNDFERITFIVVMMIGCLLVTGAAVASLSSVISIYMRPEENFRTRYRLIIQEMTNSRIPPSLREKVETFYKMYWHKQRAVSATQLLPVFPPQLPKIVHTDIYFEATQKSHLIRDLSYEFLSEVAQKMETIHYIPGDTIIKRNSQKNSMIFITYGDIEMLTAEDDISPMLRFTRGTILSPFGLYTCGGGRAHVEIRAATFCTAHVLRAEDMWRVAVKHGRDTGETLIMMSELRNHMDRVKMHYFQREAQPTKFKSSIYNFKKSLMALKEARDAKGKLLLARTDYFLEVSGCYIMRNRADASLTDDSDAICLRQTFPCILQPSSSLLTAWNWIVAVLITIVCFTHPYYLVFKQTKPLEFRFFDALMTLVYALDIIVYLSTGVNVEEGVPITFLETSLQQVRNHWFVLDLLATLPLFDFLPKGKFSGINKILRLHKVFHMMKDLEGKCVYHSNIVRFLSYTLHLVVACYLIGALQQGFMCFHFGYCLVTNYTHQPFWTKAPLDDESVSKRLSFGLYWATSMITFTTHMETWGVEKLFNAVYTMVLLEVCIVLHIFIEAVYSATIMVTTAFREDYGACIANVRNFLIRNSVDPQLRQRFTTYLELCWYTDKAYSMTVKKESVFHDLPPHVYQDILVRQSSKYILCIPFMKLLNKEDLKNVSSTARMFYTSPNEILLNTGDISTEMYVIKQGMCEILSPDTKRIVGTLSAKSHFGVLECLLRLPAFYTIRTLTHVQVFCISRKHLARGIEVPQIKDALDFAKDQEEYSRLQSRRDPFVYYHPPPSPPNRELFKLPRKHEKDLAFLQPFKRLGMFSVLRYIFPRYTFRPDGDFLRRYELFRAICALVSAMVFPSYTYMVLQWSWLYPLTCMLDICAMADTFFRMLVGYFDENGVLIYHPASTAAHYLRGAYLLDLFSCIPLENLESSRKYSFGNYYQVTTMKQVLMMNRLVQLYRLPGALSMLTRHMERQDFILVLKSLPLFLMMLNVLTSLLVFSSVRLYHSKDEHLWMIVPSKDEGGSWIYLFQDSFRFNLTASPWNLHLSCYFWIVYESTTTGYNNFSPSNSDIMHVLFLAMVLGAMSMTYVSVRIISIRANVNTVLATYQEHMKDLVQYMRSERLDKSLQKELVDYYEYNWDKTGGIDYRNVLKLCDQITLRTDAILHIYGPAFAKCPILSKCDVSLLRILGRGVRSVYFLKNTWIITEKEIIQNIYFVDSGSLQARASEVDACSATKLSIGSVFGNLDDKPTTKVPVSVIALTDVHLLQLNSEAFHRIVRDCSSPIVFELMSKYRKGNDTFIEGGVKEMTQGPFQQRGLGTPIFLHTRRRLVKSLDPRNNVIQIYHIFTALLCIYTDVYNTGFQDNRAAIIVALYVFDFGFLIKILLHLIVPVIAAQEIEKIGLMKFKRNYIKGEFKYDVASCIPIELVSFFAGENRWLLFSWLRLNRQLRLMSIHVCTKRFQERMTRSLVLTTVVVLIWYTLFVHAAACLWYFTGLAEDAADPKSCWFYDEKGKNKCNNHYICSLYFVLTTFSQNGVGDIMPKKQSEVLFVSVLQVLTTMVYMVYVGEFTNIIQYASFRAFSYYSKFLELQDFLKNNKVTPTLVKMVNKYSVHLWREARGEQLPYFLLKAPHCLKLKVMGAAYMPELRRHPVFQEFEPALVRQLVGYLRQHYYNEDMYVVKKNEITDSMYFVHTGKVEERCETQGELESVKIYTAGEYFGVFQGLVRNQPFPYSYRTLIKSQVLTLRLDDWEYLLNHFPASMAIVAKYQRFSGGDDDTPGAPRDSKFSPGWAMFQGSGGDHSFPPDAPDSTKPLEESEVNWSATSSGGSPSEPQEEPDQTSSAISRTTSKKSRSLSGIARRLSIKRSLRFIETHPQDDHPNTEVTKSDNIRRTSYIDKVKLSVKKMYAIGNQPTSQQEASSTNLQINDTTIQPELEENTSSTTLFEKIREAARSIPDEEISRYKTLKEQDASLNLKSVEDYLANKYKMRESYGVLPFRSRESTETEDFNDNKETTIPEPNPVARRPVHVWYQDEDGEVVVAQDSEEQLRERQEFLIQNRLTPTAEAIVSPDQSNAQTHDGDISRPLADVAAPLILSEEPSPPAINHSAQIKSPTSLTSGNKEVNLSNLAVEHLNLVKTASKSELVNQDKSMLQQGQTGGQHKDDTEKEQSTEGSEKENVSLEKIDSYTDIFQATHEEPAVSTVMLHSDKHRSIQGKAESDDEKEDNETENKEASTSHKKKKED